MSSEKGLLYYLHEPIYLSTVFGFSTTPQGCTPHLSHYRAPLCVRRAGKGDKQQEMKERLGCLYHKLGDRNGAPQMSALFLCETSQPVGPLAPSDSLQTRFCKTAFISCLGA